MNAHDISKPTFSIVGVLLLGLVFHLVFINSVFDCYFTSHVVHGMQHFHVKRPLAKRLVLLVGDGLRADLLYNKYAFMGVVPDAPEIVAPYLRSIAEKRGAFGISHTRVPTESRPGHVALIGGMYEDVSAVTKGWKTNPVDFDSVFNQSSHTYSFGSPDILPMFARGAVPGRVKTWMYNEDDEDFTKDATELDWWSLEHLKDLLKNATTEDGLNKELRQDKVVFFLHLLGLDTTGHSYRPFSKEYMQNIQVVDEIVKQTEKVIQNFYHDDETAFIFTADHGMSMIGNHGDGHPDNTRTPLIAWGAGVRGPLPDTTPSSHDDYSKPWDLSHLYRRDVEQADIATIMTTLLGSAWPANSVGVLPDVDAQRPGYLDSRSEHTRSEAALVNAQALLEHYRVKYETKLAHTWRFKPFTPLNNAAANDSPGEERVAAISRLLQDGDDVTALHTTRILIEDTLQGLRYLDTYDRTLIRAIVMFAYTGWMAYTSSLLLAPTVASTSILLSPVPLAMIAACWAFFFGQHASYSLYVYAVFPVFFWHHAISRLRAASTSWTERSVGESMPYIIRGMAVFVCVLSMSIGYTHRSVWSAGFVLIGLVWPVTWPREKAAAHPALTLAWAGSCICGAIFPFLSVNKEESIPMILAGAASMLGVASVWMSAAQSTGAEIEDPARDVILRQLALLLPTVFVTASAATKLANKEGLPRLLQVAGWVLLGISLLLPMASANVHVHEQSKILSLFLAFCPLFVILSISTEGLFYVTYSTVLVLWIAVETSSRTDSRDTTKQLDSGEKSGAKRAVIRVYRPQADDLRIALFFLFFVQVGFFGTGNVASISSFYLAPVYRLVPTFRPFIMAALLIMKILAPYVPLSAAFAALHVKLGLPPFALFLVALTLTDVMTIYFFFAVRDEGSWLEIGQSISFFCITSLLCVFSCGVCAAGESLVGGMMRTLAHDPKPATDDTMASTNVTVASSDQAGLVG